MKTAEERFWNLVDKNGPYCEALQSFCWNWKGSKTNGYGLFWPSPKKRLRAHVFAYNLFVGTVPTGLELDHLCRNRSCCNPAHLEAVTHQINVLRSLRCLKAGKHPKCSTPKSRKNEIRTENRCGQGHELEGDNLIFYRGKLRCRRCLSQFFERNKCDEATENPY